MRKIKFDKYAIQLARACENLDVETAVGIRQQGYAQFAMAGLAVIRVPSSVLDNSMNLEELEKILDIAWAEHCLTEGV